MELALQDILSGELPIADRVKHLSDKRIIVPQWGGDRGLLRAYDPSLHPVMDRSIYPDHPNPDGTVEKVTRIVLGWQQLAVKRMAELCFATPVKRIYTPENPAQERVAKLLEAIYQRNRIDSLNINRGRAYFASCEMATLWYAVEEPNSRYGIQSPIKVRSKTFSPMDGDTLYPRFNSAGDLEAFSIAHPHATQDDTELYFDTYTKDRHIQWVKRKETWYATVDETIALGKIPLSYIWRPEPICESTSHLVYECEWVLSRNGNYLRRNSKFVFCVAADEEFTSGEEKDEKHEFRSILQIPQGGSAQYVTWEGATKNLKFYIQKLRQAYFTQLQLPDFSFETIKSTPMSGEARKQLFIDAQIKVNDEKGCLLEFFDRELNVLRTFAKAILPTADHAAVDALRVETIITPFSITDERDELERLLLANGHKPLVSQRESIQLLGWSDNPTETLREIGEQEAGVNLNLGI